MTNFSETNLGCRHRVSSGLDWVFDNVQEAIVLEDDCLPHHTFFRFCDEMLEKYRNDKRVHMVRGCNFLQGRRLGGSSYYFSRFYNIWGWASWARAWQYYDVNMKEWPARRDSGWLATLLPTKAMVEQARHIFDETYAGRFTTWDYQWVFASWLQNALAITPATNLVRNIGHGANATHTRSTGDTLASMTTKGIRFPLRHPAAVAVHEQADRLEWEILNIQPRRRKSIKRRVLRALKSIKRTAWVRP